MEFNLKLFIRFFPIFLNGFAVTIKFTFICILLSIIIGFFLGILCSFRLPVIKNIFKWYIDLFRETPLIVQLYLMYYGLPYIGIMLPASVAGILAITLNESAFIAEIVRGGIEAVSPGQKKASLALGFSNLQSLRYVILPQTLKSIFPSLIGQSSYILKDTSLLTLVAIAELTSASRYLNSMYLIPGTTFLGAAIFYNITFWSLQLAVYIIQKYYLKSGANNGYR